MIQDVIKPLFRLPIAARIGLLASLPFLMAALTLGTVVYKDLETTSLDVEFNNLNNDLLLYRNEVAELNKSRISKTQPCIESDILASVDTLDGPSFRYESPGCPAIGNGFVPVDIQSCYDGPCTTRVQTDEGQLIEVVAIGVSLGDAACSDSQFLSLPGGNGCLMVWRPLGDHFKRITKSRTWPMITIAVALIGTIVAVLLIARRISSRISDINRAFRDFSDGDRNAAARVHESGNELDELALATNQALRKIQQDIAASQRVSGSLSHQLLGPVRHIRNTVAGILESEELQHRDQDGDRQQRAWIQQLEQVETEVNHVIGMGESLLNLLSSSRKRTPQELSNVIELDELCSVMAARYRTKARQRRIDILIDAEPVEAVSSLQVVDHMVGNLLDNAIIYGPSQSIITLSAGEKDNEVWLAIHDQGGGPPEEIVKNVFGKTVAVSAATSAREGAGGNGIGLLTVRQLADNCNIRLSQQAYENGWTVILRWPRA